MTTHENAARQRLADACHHVADRGLSPGGSGSLSVRVGDAVLVTATGSSCSRVRPEGLARIALEGPSDAAGPRPSKEAGLHQAVYRARPDARAVVHLHAHWTVAASCLPSAGAGAPATGPLPAVTPYQVMRLGALPVAAYAPPGSAELARFVGELVGDHPVLLLANHGCVTAADDLDRAVDLAEELEAAARLHFALLGVEHRRLTPDQVAALQR